LAAAAKQAAFEKGVTLTSEEDILRFAWNMWNGTNRIAGVGKESIKVSFVVRPDLGLSLRQPSAGTFPGLGVSCWEGAVIYEPSPEELLQRNGVLRYFRLEMNVRFNTNEHGPATPLVLIGYWDPTLEDWMPLCLCTFFQVHNYDLIF